MRRFVSLGALGECAKSLFVHSSCTREIIPRYHRTCKDSLCGYGKYGKLRKTYKKLC